MAQLRPQQRAADGQQREVMRRAGGQLRLHCANGQLRPLHWGGCTQSGQAIQHACDCLGLRLGAHLVGSTAHTGCSVAVMVAGLEVCVCGLEEAGQPGAWRAEAQPSQCIDRGGQHVHGGAAGGRQAVHERSACGLCAVNAAGEGGW